MNSRSLNLSPRRRYSPNHGYGILDRVTVSVCLDVGRPDHLSPLLGLFDDDLLKLGRRHRHWHTAELGKTRLDLFVGEGGVYFLVERDNDFVGSAFGRADALPRACLEP